LIEVPAPVLRWFRSPRDQYWYYNASKSLFLATSDFLGPEKSTGIQW
jgi:hypothetical protein